MWYDFGVTLNDGTRLTCIGVDITASLEDVVGYGLAARASEVLIYQLKAPGPNFIHLLLHLIDFPPSCNHNIYPLPHYTPGLFRIASIRCKSLDYHRYDESVPEELRAVENLALRRWRLEPSESDRDIHLMQVYVMSDEVEEQS